jgi:hypothetical protein
VALPEGESSVRFVHLVFPSEVMKLQGKIFGLVIFPLQFLMWLKYSLFNTVLCKILGSGLFAYIFSKDTLFLSKLAKYYHPKKYFKNHQLTVGRRPRRLLEGADEGSWGVTSAVAAVPWHSAVPSSSLSSSSEAVWAHASSLLASLESSSPWSLRITAFFVLVLFFLEVKSASISAASVRGSSFAFGSGLSVIVRLFNTSPTASEAGTDGEAVCCFLRPFPVEDLLKAGGLAGGNVSDKTEDSVRTGDPDFSEDLRVDLLIVDLKL